MGKQSVLEIILALNSSKIRYLIAGGLAVVAHGFIRFTADLDLILAMDKRNLTAAVEALLALNYRPQAPVVFEQFISPESRDQWMHEKGLTVFSLYSPDHPMTEIDLFIDPPLDFEAAYERAVYLEVASGVKATFVSVDDLICMKAQAGRSQDIEDIARLQKLHNGVSVEPDDGSANKMEVVDMQNGGATNE